MVTLETVDGRNLQKESQYLIVYKKKEVPDINMEIIVIIIEEKRISVNKIESLNVILRRVEGMDCDQGLDLHLDGSVDLDLRAHQEEERDKL